ncbi:hypothetical protein DIURU_002101 [Diutina rugosa]|uniref:Autophagy-related protein 27 n=1 Tax=Diutina rugosa TaxID=5481 RepID=A0A642URB1_DIURU|nr:uncharacterized protein DIURU_002101 [Diutina rugosa]KAA8903879.1 hypothetical protein DIURU_002101 [Diutina rugosa]
MKTFATLVTAFAAFSMAFDCSIPELEKYNLEVVRGVHAVSDLTQTPPSETNQTWYVGVCSSIDKVDACPDGSDVCGITKVRVKDTELTTNIIGIGSASTKKFNAIDGDESKGVIITYEGVQWGSKKVDAELRFVCDSTKEKGNLEVVSWDGHKVTVQIVTKGACLTKRGDKKKDPSDDSGHADKGESWGWFTWIFIFMVLFLSIYIIGGAWFQYNKGNSIDFQSALREVVENFVDVVRGLPAFVSEILKKVTGNSNRGEYSAV